MEVLGVIVRMQRPQAIAQHAVPLGVPRAPFLGTARDPQRVHRVAEILGPVASLKCQRLVSPGTREEVVHGAKESGVRPRASYPRQLPPQPTETLSNALTKLR